MSASHSPRHAAGAVPAAAAALRHRDARRATWVLLVTSGVYAVLVGTAALGGPSLGGPFFPQGPTATHTTSDDGRGDADASLDPPDSSSGSPGTAAPEPLPTTSIEATDPAATGTDETTPVTSGGGPSPTSPASTTTRAGDPTKPTPTASESTPGKSGQAPGVTKRPPKPKP